MPRSLLWNPDRNREYPGIANFALQRHLAIMAAHDSMIAARVKQTRAANRHRQPAPFEEKDLVYLSTKNIKFEKGLARKMIPKFIGPYLIIRDFNNGSFELDLPSNMKQRGIHNVFHSSLLRPHIPNDDRRFPGRLENQLGISLDGETNEWAVDKITNHYGRRTKSLFEILWKSGDKSWMPYDQAKRLQALPEYLEAVGVSDVKELPYGSGKPPVAAQDLFLGCVAINLFDDKSAWIPDEFAPTLSLPKPMPTNPVFLNSFDTSGLIPRHADQNLLHSVLKRVSKRYFTFQVTPGSAVTIIDARTVRLFCDYNAAIIHGDDLPEREPTFYVPFARAMNNYDTSGLKWAYLEDELIVFDDAYDAADAEAFCVLDAETSDLPVLGPNEVAVSRTYFQHAERLRSQAEKREVKYANLREKKAHLAAEGVVDVNSKAAREGLAAKRKILEDAKAEEAANKRQKGNDGAPVAGPSGASGDEGEQDTHMG